MDYLSEARRKKKENAFNMAVVALSTLFHKNLNKAINPTIFFSEEQMLNITEINKLGYERMEKILSHGSTWTDDEYLLIFTYRINFQLITDYYSYYGLSLNINRKINDLDEMIKRSIEDSTNEKNARRAAATISKNQKKELDTLWMKSVFYTGGIKM